VSVCVCMCARVYVCTHEGKERGRACVRAYARVRESNRPMPTKENTLVNARQGKAMLSERASERVTYTRTSLVPGNVLNSLLLHGLQHALVQHRRVDPAVPVRRSRQRALVLKNQVACQAQRG
jgi:hypothetical protein